ncbi:MAG: hypothetical protein A3C43_06180 [Candidatus Schekmanbacteria bacterium RIFCSPHIGHO2_02_FULL_38_11]|uniref:DUF2231 domain-containing protein n=1 Tax=Candidatus Schekmanbacteria bacterium RIFCSPLOWO2_12_FULL_38_15 TaxID=1817883 RepID=A0A1F7SFQ7_9BACT|nr:MAG: hypothetical protein A2043_11635 [Candidatus Schekmanbacteria bacterium GWA2_38_9]OGL48615.1 MAG: hypothetical protein A3H37_06000 [Candidatus Schekmanbacteria bacterium RIFCSPLOWO2_02_FULL_38_14]OGL50160.1 MAG: hypothetical protein A3C43_06180 [Candidatus Schekmanbacteria bacterium RIFCSPHIGHO2_02_FULL_38_11]OGL52595.1 MAG: hypothetical protein A3G31_11560 [Candidatus Schekmanbacteria bacterium RIFCSPLOWO2_12_FULL_38_15]
MAEIIPAGIQHLQNIHPVTVHFPIAFLMGAALFYFLAWVLKKESLAYTGFLMLIVGALSAIIAVSTGLYAEPGVMISRSVRARLLEPHKNLMLTTLGISIILAVWSLISRPFPKKGKTIFMLLFLAMLAVMGIGADYGARMVYDYNAGGNACAQPIEFTK